jgi:hypothetical protein
MPIDDRATVDWELNRRPRHGTELGQHERHALGHNEVSQLGHRALARDRGQRTVRWRPDWGIRLPPSPPHSSRFNDFSVAACSLR